MLCQFLRYALPVASTLWIAQKVMGKDDQGEQKVKGPWGLATLVALPLSLGGSVACGVANLARSQQGQAQNINAVSPIPEQTAPPTEPNPVEGWGMAAWNRRL